MIKFTLTLMAFMYSLAIFCQTPTGTFVGTVTDQDEGNDPLPFAHVLVCQNDSIIYGTKTDFDGLYKISNIALGSYEVVVRAPAKIVMKDSLHIEKQINIDRNYELMSNFGLYSQTYIYKETTNNCEVDSTTRIKRKFNLKLLSKPSKQKI